MALQTQIEWTGVTWNPVTGCSKVSEGCRHCYAHRLALRLRAMGNRRYANGFRVTLHKDLVDAPLRWRSPRLVFVNSMSDLFHHKVPVYFLRQVFETMNKCRRHTFQILTKRSDRLRQLAGKLEWTKNIWMGVSVENESVYPRIEDLRQVSAKVRFLSCEPLIGPMEKLPLENIHWVIVGGESGPGARPIKTEWARSIRDQCQQAGVAFFFKQWGGVFKHQHGRMLDNRTYDEMPI